MFLSSLCLVVSTGEGDGAGLEGDESLEEGAATPMHGLLSELYERVSLQGIEFGGPSLHDSPYVSTKRPRSARSGRVLLDAIHGAAKARVADRSKEPHESNRVSAALNGTRPPGIGFYH